MPVDIRATVSCSLGTVISGNVNDEYVQGTGLIKCSGTVLINGIITPAIGTAVTFSYVKGGVSRTIPRKLRVLSSFADPFRRTTSVELGCKLTYLSDKRDSIDWTAFDDEDNTLTEDDAEIITIPIRAQAVAKKCMDELGISSTFTLTNKFSVAEFDLSPGYVQVLSDLLVSESLCGYLDANETLQVFSLDQAGGTGPVLDATQLVDISKIGVGQLPGEAVVVSYNSLKLKRDVDQGGETGGSRWESETTTNRNNVIIPYQFTQGGTVFFDSKQYNILETSTTTTYFKVIKTKDGPKRVVDYRQSTFTTGSASVLGGLASEYLNNGINFTNIPIAKTVTETYEYDGEGNEVRIERVTKGSSYYITGSLGVPFVFPDSYVILSSKIILLAREITTREIAGGVQKETTINYGPWHTTISGQQTIAASRDSFSSASEVVAFMNGLGIGDLGLLDVRVSINRKGPPAVSVDQATVNNANNAKGGDPSNGYRTESKAELELALGSATAQRRIELSLPYAPDDTFVKSGSTYSSIESDAAQKAQRYGIVQNRLLLGNRNGMNIQVAPEILPGAPFSPFVIRSGSTSALYRTNGTNWTFDASGLVASTDALFWGGVGGNAGQSWFPIAPGITTLPTTPGTTTVNIVDGNGNVIGSYEQMVVPGTVPVAQETRLLQATLRLRPVVTGLDYALEQEAEITATTKVRAVITSIRTITPPVAAVTVAAIAPAISTGASVTAPLVTVSLAGVAPMVANGISVTVPVAVVTVAGIAPEAGGRPKIQVLVPSAAITIAGLMPTVARGVAIAVPIAAVTVAGVVPSIQTVANDPYFASVSLLLHMDGSNGSTTFADSSSNELAVTAVGNASISTAQSKFGAASAYFDGSGDYLSVASSTALDLTADFTIEFFVYPTITLGAVGFIARPNASNISPIRIDVTGGVVRLSASSDGTAFTTIASGGLPSANTWTHVAVSRSSDTWRIFIGGTQSASATNSLTPFTSTNAMIIGARVTFANFITGYIDELRITKGVARYTANFTPPTAPFPDA